MVFTGTPHARRSWETLSTDRGLGCSRAFGDNAKTLSSHRKLDLAIQAQSLAMLMLF